MTQETVISLQSSTMADRTNSTFPSANNSNSLPLLVSIPPALPTSSSPPIPSTAQSGSSMAPDSKKPCDISNLMSPPEPAPLENFHQGAASMPCPPPRSTMATEKRPAPNAPLSPPVSPFTTGGDTVEPLASITVATHDPILYPSSDSSSPPSRPLFDAAADSSVGAQQAVDEHIAARSPALFRAVSPPEQEHYKLALFFKSEVMKRFSENPRKWLLKEREQLMADRLAGAKRNKQLHPILPAAKPAVLRPSLHAQKIVKPERAKRPAREAPTRIAPRAGGSPRHPSARPPSATPEPRSRTIAPSRDDKDFEALPDYCPPLGTLPHRANSLKVEWKGAPLDISSDPYLRLLHPDEAALASSLRLDCATYLTSKRRIFQRRLECAAIPKEFRKTDAQQACKIDVNKASKLWTAFDKVGWLDIKHMQPFMSHAAH